MSCINEFAYDPILKHSVELRKYQRKMEHLILLTSTLRKIKYKSRRNAILDSLPSIPVLPELPDDEYVKIYRKERKDASMIPFSEYDLQAILSRVIARIFFLYGFSECPKKLLSYMTYVVENYIKSFIDLMRKNSQSEEFLSIESFKAALPHIGLSDIGVLHHYYTQNVIRFHDRLFKVCKQLKNKLELNLKVRDATPRKKFKTK